MWHFHETGCGRPLVLLHGIGMSHAAWNAVTPHLAPTRRVIAFDIAGFGATPRLPRGTAPTIPHLADGLAQALLAIGIDGPVDIAGNSLGGTLALEAARRGIARTVVALSPAGLWRTHDAVHVKYVFKALRLMAAHIPRAMKMIMRVPALREAALAVPISIGSRHMPAIDARRAVDDLAIATGFEDTFDNTRRPFIAHDITAPVTVVFGDYDWILTGGSRCRSALPPHTRWIEKHGWGHVPMWIDPTGVAQLILEASM